MKLLQLVVDQLSVDCVNNENLPGISAMGDEVEAIIDTSMISKKRRITYDLEITSATRGTLETISSEEEISGTRDKAARRVMESLKNDS
ncbi:hypothetical protein Cni_G28199 [Canna indica]|uniref:Uncharacterized protein n=1 Tax=Canna indica TaxID=4628 RepID=A0AAQ3QNL5_9LILI|nr:hypothetical protein Cni_G28199 [Canna indica]